MNNLIIYSDSILCPSCKVVNFIQNFYCTEGESHFHLCQNCRCRFIWRYLRRKEWILIQSMFVPTDIIYKNADFNSLTQEEKADFLANILCDILPMKHKTDRLTSGVVVDRLLDIFDIVCLTKEKSRKVDEALNKLQKDNDNLNA